jgi:hypothetical protein
MAGKLNHGHQVLGRNDEFVYICFVHKQRVRRYYRMPD